MDNKAKVYAEVIEPIVTELKLLCHKHQIPMLLTCAVGDTEYRNEMVSASIVDQTLPDDKLVEMVKILNGFIAVPKEEPLELDFDVE